ncbi:MAG: hydroxymethylglutaryl-CoA reductase, partial [Gammaproteobacteria bacterium]|nr:hydroxymethylglutaryl-CoA reductase [Gammaproteobacteria bacterium]
MDKARFPGFYKLSIGERLKKVHENGWLSEQDLLSLRDGHHTLPLSRADKMIENVVGVMGLPLGLGLNFNVNQKNYIVPLAVEEPSIVAALSSAAKIFSE